AQRGDCERTPDRRPRAEARHRPAGEQRRDDGWREHEMDQADIHPPERQRAEVLNRHKDVQYSSRIASHIARQQQAHRLRHVINQLAARLPESERNSEAVRDLAGYGCPTRMHVVRLLAPQLTREDHTKDIDFSPSGIMQRWDAGYRHTKAVLERKPWIG